MAVACGYDNGDKERVEAIDLTATSVASIDTDAQMDNLESGVGVFVQYAAGGTWTIQFACDTESSGLDCLWDVYAYTTNGGPIYSFSELDLESADYASVSTDGVARLMPITTTDLDGIELVIDEGEPLTLDVRLEGETEPNQFIFWMSDGEVVQGAETAVVELTPTAS